MASSQADDQLNKLKRSSWSSSEKALCGITQSCKMIRQNWVEDPMTDPWCWYINANKNGDGIHGAPYIAAPLGSYGDAPKFRNKHHHISPAMAPHLQLLLDACCGQQLAADFQCCSELAGVASGRRRKQRKIWTFTQLPSGK